jgi:hypothetical protein
MLLVRYTTIDSPEEARAILPQLQAEALPQPGGAHRPDQFQSAGAAWRRLARRYRRKFVRLLWQRFSGRGEATPLALQPTAAEHQGVRLEFDWGA